MTNDALLTPLLPNTFRENGVSHDRLRAALTADPALVGRVSYDADGTIVLTGPKGGAAPASAKERKRWELHVRLRLAAEFGGDAAGAIVRWAEPGTPYPAP